MTDRHYSVWHKNSKRNRNNNLSLKEGFTLKPDKENKTVNLQQQHVTQQLVNHQLQTLSDWRAKLAQHVIVPNEGSGRIKAGDPRRLVFAVQHQTK